LKAISLESGKPSSTGRQSVYDVIQLCNVLHHNDGDLILFPQSEIKDTVK